MIALVLALRGAAAALVLVALTGGIPRVVQVGLAAIAGLSSAALAGAIDGAVDGAINGLGPDPAGTALGLVAARELAIGATLGLLAALPLLAVATAGRLVDLSSLASGAGWRGPYAPLFGILGAAVFVGIDGHVAFLAAIASSFRDVPASDVPASAVDASRMLAALGALVPRAAQLAIPWLVTAAVVEIAAGVAARLAGRAALHAPLGAATPAALAMMTATLVGTLAVAIAALVRGA